MLLKVNLMNMVMCPQVDNRAHICIEGQPYSKSKNYQPFHMVLSFYQTAVGNLGLESFRKESN